MLTRSDITILMQQVDVTKALDLLTMFKEAGKEANKPTRVSFLIRPSGR